MLWESGAIRQKHPNIKSITVALKCQECFEVKNYVPIFSFYLFVFVNTVFLRMVGIPYRHLASCPGLAFSNNPTRASLE